MERKAEKFLKRLASKLPQNYKAEGAVDVFQSLIDSLEKGPVKKTILDDLEHFYTVFQTALEDVTGTGATTSLPASTTVSDAVPSSFPLVKARILLGPIDDNFPQVDWNGNYDACLDDNSVTLKMLLAVQCHTGPFDAMRIAKLLVRSGTTSRDIQTARETAIELSNTMLTYMSLHDNSGDAAISAGCIWAYCAVFGSCTNFTSLLSTLLVMTTNMPELWSYAFGFLGYWDSRQSSTPVSGDSVEMLQSLIECSMSSLVEHAVDVSSDDLVLCLSSLYVWVHRHSDPSSRTRLLSTIASEVARTHRRLQASAPLFWSDMLVPLIAASDASFSKKELRQYKDVPSKSNSTVADILGWLSKQSNSAVANALAGSLAQKVVARSSATHREDDEAEGDDEDEDEDMGDVDNTAENGQGAKKKKNRKRAHSLSEEADEEEDVSMSFFIDTTGTAGKGGAAVSSVLGSMYDDDVVIPGETDEVQAPSEMEKELQRLQSSTGSSASSSAKKATKGSSKKAKASATATSADTASPTPIAIATAPATATETPKAAKSSQSKPAAATTSEKVGKRARANSTSSTSSNAVAPGSARPSRSAKEHPTSDASKWAFLGESFPSAKKQAITTTSGIVDASASGKKRPKSSTNSK
jgi:hypothetical protein